MNIQALAEQLKERILQNVSQGIDRHGKPFKPYSTRPFAMPFVAVQPRSLITEAQRKGEARVFRGIGQRKNILWVTWLGGYVQYKGLLGKQVSPVNLKLSGKMLSSLNSSGQVIKESFTITLDDPNITGELEIDIPEAILTIGFSDAEAEQVAYWNILRERDFLGLTDEETEEVIKKFLEKTE